MSLSAAKQIFDAARSPGRDLGALAVSASINPEFLRNLAKAFVAVDGEYQDLRAQLTAPGMPTTARLAANRYEHLEIMIPECERLAPEYDLNSVEEQLIAGFCGFTHDGGRFREALLRTESLATNLDGINKRPHAVYGVQLLHESGALTFFEPEIATAIEDAVLNHAEREVELDRGSLAWKLCYIIRDHDKKEILTTDNDHTTTAEGLSHEIMKHFLRQWFDDVELGRRLQDDDEVKREVEQVLKRSFRDSGDRSVYVSPLFAEGKRGPFVTRDQVRAATRFFIDASPSPDAMEEFIQGGSMSMQSYWRAAANVWLSMFAMMSDIQNVGILREVLHHPATDQRLSLLRQRCTPSQYRTLLNRVECYRRREEREALDRPSIEQ